MSDKPPLRIQLSRRKGFNLQQTSLALNGRAAVNCARPGAWGNPFVVGRDGTREQCVGFHSLLLNGLVCLTCDGERKPPAHVVLAVFREAIS